VTIPRLESDSYVLLEAIVRLRHLHGGLNPTLESCCDEVGASFDDIHQRRPGTRDDSFVRSIGKKPLN
jgi:hypothetical protein